MECWSSFENTFIKAKKIPRNSLVDYKIKMAAIGFYTDFLIGAHAFFCCNIGQCSLISKFGMARVNTAGNFILYFQ